MMRLALGLPLAGVLMLIGLGCSSALPVPPKYPPVTSPVEVSPDGRTITVHAAKPCGHRPLLIARSLPGRVTLRLVNRGVSGCHVEAVGVITVSVTLPRPLGTRPLVQAINGKRINYHVGHF